MKVVILAGGFGTRISEESHLKPKPMIEVGEHPILWHIMMDSGNRWIRCVTRLNLMNSGTEAQLNGRSGRW